MEYWDYPEEKTELFEASDRNYYWSTGSMYTFLCSRQDLDRIDPWKDLTDGGWVIASYLRCDVVEHGSVVFAGHEAEDLKEKSGKFVIVRSMPFVYRVQTWGERKLSSYEVRSDEGFNEALQPLFFMSRKKALKKALELSKGDDCRYLVSRQLDSFDRH
ncbi:MAG: hypothetical protein IK026_02580 [Eubacteriaceae bacterium]|nr:hypothetical protein [Eubacteriaceae bacterium]